MARLNSTSVKTVRPPYLSVQMPRGMLTAAAQKGSIAAKISTWVALKSYHLIRKGASAENIPQTAKPSANARDDIHKTLELPGGSTVPLAAITGFSTTAPNFKEMADASLRSAPPTHDDAQATLPGHHKRLLASA
jgi:hypothetical protein